MLFVKNFPLIIARLGGANAEPGFFLNVRGLGSDRNETLHGVLRDKAKTFSCAEFVYMIRMAMQINVWRSVGAHVAGYHHKGKGNTNNFIRYVLCNVACFHTRQFVSAGMAFRGIEWGICWVVIRNCAAAKKTIWTIW
jgi:hypothetical protein